MSTEKPDHHDAELVLKAYDLRRETVMRDSRNAINGKFWPKTYEEVTAILKAEHPLNAAYRQVATYWEMIYGMVRHGVVHADYFMESNGEGLLLFAKVAPHVARLREEYSPNAFRSAEWVARETETGRRTFAMFEARVRKALEAPAR